MKRYIIAVILSVILPMAVMAQSSMTDDQVMKFIVKEHNAGSSQSQIVTKLMQNGVDINQIRRVRKKYERASKDGLGQVSSTTGSKNDTRLRTGKKGKGNGEDEEEGVRTQHLQQQESFVRTEHEYRHAAELQTGSWRCRVHRYIRSFAEDRGVHCFARWIRDY